MITVGLCILLCSQALARPEHGYYASNEDIDQHIVNGQNVEKGKYPWMLSLEVFDPEFRHTCGSSLLDTRHALTAAHCLDGRFPDMDFRVAIGCSYRGDEANPSGDCEARVNVVAAVLHEDYNSGPGAYPNDIAVMYLETEVEMNENVTGATLGSPDIDYIGQECYSSGWGKLDGGDTDVPVKLQEIQIDLLSTDDCRNAMPVGGNINVQPNVHQCIFDTREVPDDEKRGICQGDSGGPVQCNIDGEWHVLGAASWVIGGPGTDTCNPAYPGVYANAPFYLDWIQAQIDDPSWKPEP